MVQHNFGYETAGSSYYSIGDCIRGSVFTIPEAGTADSITACLYALGNTSQPTKCAIYLHSDLSLKGTTEQRTIAYTTTSTWQTFNFAEPKPSLTTTTAYVLVAWADVTDYGPSLRYNAGDANQEHHQNIAYGGFPDPLAPTHGNSKYSIYCTYTVAGGGVTVKKGSNLANTMTEMLNSKLLFSACNRFPKLTTRRF